MATERSYDRLNAGALGVVSLAIVVAIGAIVLANMQPASLQTEDLGTEAFQPSTPLPSNVTVSEASNNDFVRVVEDSETLVFEDTSAGTNTTLTVDTDYVPFYDEGTFEIQDTSATTDYNDTEDNIYVTEYTEEYEGAAYSVLGTGIDSMQTFADFFTVIVILLVASVLFLLLRAVRRTGTA